MGSKTSKVSPDTFTESENESINNLYNKFQKNSQFDVSSMNEQIFFGLNLNIINFLNSVYEAKKYSKINFITYDDFVFLAFVLSKINQKDDNIFNIYFGKSTLQILYDLLMGKFGKCEETLDIDKFIEILCFSVDIFNSVQKTKLEFNRKIFSDNIKNNLLIDSKKKSISFESIKNFTDNLFYNLEPYLKQYFIHVFLKDFQNLQFSFALPIFTINSNFLSIDQYLSFLLLNPHVFGNPYAFKLYDCSKMGFNIPELIYSFLGFGGPVGIFIEHFENIKKQRYILGIYLNSNFKDCYENYCGDDLTFLFSLYPKIEKYKYEGSSKNICFLCRRAQNFSKMIPGIGIGFNIDGHKLWLDANDLFKKSYFKKHDQVFESGTPFEDVEHNLNITNIEVYGFGNEEAYKALFKKQKKDKDISEKMKQVDKAQFLENEFDKEMFLGGTFSHQKDVYK